MRTCNTYRAAPTDFLPQKRPKKIAKASPLELKSNIASAHIAKIGQHFKDTESPEKFIIDSIVLPTKTSGPESKTFFYKMFYSTQYNHPTHSRVFEYIPCSEISNTKYVRWIPRGNSSIAAAILSAAPHDMLRNPNQTHDGLTLNFKHKTDPKHHRYRGVSSIAKIRHSPTYSLYSNT